VCVEAHLRAEFAKLGSPNKLTISPLHGGQCRTLLLF
jgi:hypothetical protein